MSKSRARRIMVLDLETDPFQRGGADIQPFVWGIFDGDRFEHRWGTEGCIRSLVERIEDEHAIIYAHNGGQFDFLFMVEHLAGDVLVINGRIVEAKIGKATLRDSFMILPRPLAEIGPKHDFDYAKMRPAVRDRHRRAIVDYLEQDCRVLHGAVLRFHERFGRKLTMSSASMAELRKEIERSERRDAGITLQRLSLEKDAAIRPFFIGGRVQVLEGGVIEDGMRYFDCNSMFPHVMKKYAHPTGNQWMPARDLDEADFATVEATAEGCLPWRSDDGRLVYPRDRRVFKVTGHELRAAMQLGRVRVHAIHQAITFPVRRVFDAFVNTFYTLRREAQAAGDASLAMFYKDVLNRAYGRFALNPDGILRWQVVPNGQAPDEEGFEPRFVGDKVTFWAKAAEDQDKRRAMGNVATAASITGAARAELMFAMHTAERPIYCDTDAVIARDLERPIGTEIGDWKIEAEGDRVAIAGKKLYVMWKGPEVVKMACRGVRLTGSQIEKVARGEAQWWLADAPSISIAGVQTFMKRQIRATF